MSKVLKVATIASTGHEHAHKLLKQDYDKRHPDDPLPELGFFSHAAIHNLLVQDYNETQADETLPTVRPESSGHLDVHNKLASNYNRKNGLSLF